MLFPSNLGRRSCFFVILFFLSKSFLVLFFKKEQNPYAKQLNLNAKNEKNSLTNAMKHVIIHSVNKGDDGKSSLGEADRERGIWWKPFAQNLGEDPSGAAVLNGFCPVGAAALPCVMG